MLTYEIAIEGMSCQGCVKHVTEALEGLPGVQAVEVALAENRARVGAAGEIPRALIESAIDEAGYKVVAVHPA